MLVWSLQHTRETVHQRSLYARVVHLINTQRYSVCYIESITQMNEIMMTALLTGVHVKIKMSRTDYWVEELPSLKIVGLCIC